MKLLGHGRGDGIVLAIEVAEDEPIRKAVERYKEAGGGEVIAVSVEDEDEDLDLELIVHERLKPNAHLHFHKTCKHVEVRVLFAGHETIHRSFRANKRLELVFDWAVGPEGYDLSPVDAGELVLALPGPPPVRVNPDLQIADLETRDCTLTLALVPKSFFNG